MEIPPPQAASPSPSKRRGYYKKLSRMQYYQKLLKTRPQAYILADDRIPSEQVTVAHAINQKIYANLTAAQNKANWFNNTFALVGVRYVVHLVKSPLYPQESPDLSTNKSDQAPPECNSSLSVT